MTIATILANIALGAGVTTVVTSVAVVVPRRIDRWTGDLTARYTPPLAAHDPGLSLAEPAAAALAV